ncbi:cytochrome b6-f complex subunit PetL [Candidatus Gracilibacteria bacterium]|nr:cytochrome b6-f complex subunit PetL [Candidatus Gracilibacteria bacterium]NJM89095.1 cytochrome b6-f complex subunit PetL [Hydrococcus sp. RU_2_2]NJP17932.1 cytochrome b6-f complex subunit PetL [Hydrococcus sp. CRU_1_1]NJQ98619.1 cytochrome b6-f complex subunit PetL [Hydrococcus sp. CSU_1_8]
MSAVISYIAIILLFTAIALGLFFGLRIAKII